MKNRISTILVAGTLMLTMLTTPSCIGSFSLSNRLLAWNRTVENKFINELVFVAFWVLPVYEVCGLADFLVLNSIEFWSGSNPVKHSAATQTVEGSDGTRYLVKADERGYDIISEADGTSVRLDFVADEQAWYFETPEGTRQMLFAFVDDTHLRVPAPDGTTVVVEASQAGLMAYRALAADATLYACR